LKNTVRIAGAVLIAFTSVACQGGSSALTAPTAAGLDGAARASSLSGATWRLTEINGQGALADVAVTASFASPDRVSGSGGCNRYTGAATADNGQLTVGALAATRMYCAEAGVAAQEDAYFSALAKATGYTVLGTELRLGAEKGDATLVFVRE